MIRHNHSKKSMGCCKSSAEREIQRTTGLPQKRRKISNWQFNPLPKWISKEEQTKPKISRSKEIIKFRWEIKKIEIQKTIEKNQ